MTYAVKSERDGKWIAVYRDNNDQLRQARDARGKFIRCETEALALSVARYRRRRLKRWR